MNTALDRLLALKLQGRNPLAYAEIDRVCSLPIRRPLAPEEQGFLQREILLPAAYHEGFRLTEAQIDGLIEYEQSKGLFAPICVGGGKTLLTLLIAGTWLRENTEGRAALLIPSSVLAQLVQRDLPWARKRVKIDYQVFEVSGAAPLAKRRTVATCQRPGLYIMTYSVLSTKDASFLLDSVAPGLFILDEAHQVARRTAARTRRLLKHLKEQPETPQIVCLSGTITNKSLRDYHHLARACLGQGAFLPLPVNLMQEWATVLDSTYLGNGATMGAVRPLLEWARRVDPEGDYPTETEGFRRAYQTRLRTTPGVVVSPSASVGTSILIRNKLEIPEPGKELQAFIAGVVDQWVTPNGDELSHAIHKFKWLYELSAGFYNQLLWQTPEELAEAQHLSVSEAAELLERARRHHELSQEYNKILRVWLLDHHIKGLDTPMLVAAHMAVNEDRLVGREMYDAWRRVKEAEFEGMPERYSKPVRVDDFKVRALVRWARDNQDETRLVWVHNIEFGEWVCEALRAAGEDVCHAPAGTHELEDSERMRGRVCVASISAHKLGKNLQHFGATVFGQWPRPANLAEQAMGRNHRKGQWRDELVYDLLLVTEFDRDCFAATLNDAAYIQQSLGAQQKLLIASYDPPPQVVSSEVLNELGFRAKTLDKQARTALARWDKE